MTENKIWLHSQLFLCFEIRCSEYIILLLWLQIFDLDCYDAVNCCCFLSDVCVACGTQDGRITVTDLRNIRLKKAIYFS